MSIEQVACVRFNLAIQGSCSLEFGSNCCTPWNLATLVTEELHPLQHHKFCSELEGMCCFDLAAEPVGIEDIIQNLQDYKSQPTGGTWLTVWVTSLTGGVEHLAQSIICLFVYSFSPTLKCLCKSPIPHFQPWQQWSLEQGGGKLGGTG